LTCKQAMGKYSQFRIDSMILTPPHKQVHFCSGLT
jgi:hypothetical protein